MVESRLLMAALVPLMAACAPAATSAASSGYLIWVDGMAKVMIDAGGGPFPGLNAYLESMLSKEHGAYGYLSGYLDRSPERW